MILKIGGKSPPGVKTVEKEGKKEEKKETNKKKWEKCEERCPGDPWAYCVVLWCACAMSLISSGYSLYRQQGLQGRLSLLEEQHLALRSAVLEPQQPLVERLRREVARQPYWRPRRSLRDYGDCVCPPGKLLNIQYILLTGYFNVFNHNSSTFMSIYLDLLIRHLQSENKKK